MRSLYAAFMFRIYFPQAASIFVIGDFNNWSTVANMMNLNEEGKWETSIMLPPGEYRYGYFALIPVLNGEARSPRYAGMVIPNESTLVVSSEGNPGRWTRDVIARDADQFAGT